MVNDARERWFSDLVDAGLETQILDAPQIVEHATPDVLAENLPADLLAKVLQSALKAGAMTPERMLDTLTPAILARHVPHPILWACVATAAERRGLADANGEVPAGDPRRTFIRRGLQSALDAGVATPDDVLAHATAEVIAEYLPAEHKAKLLAAGLAANEMNPRLVVDTVGVDAFAAHVPVGVMWACLRAVGDRAVAGAAVGTAGKRAAAGAGAAGKRAGAGASTAGKRAATRRAAAATAASRGAKSKRADAEDASARPAGGAAARPLAPPPFDDDTSVHNWAGAEDFEVVEEEDLGAAADSVIGAATDWDDNTNVGA